MRCVYRKVAGVASPKLENGQKLLEHYRRRDNVDHPLSTSTPQDQGDPSAWIADLVPPAATQKAATIPDKLKIDPTLALAFLDGFAAVAREYYLLRNYDRVSQNGRAIVTFEIARELLKGVHTWRRTLQILKQGEGITWDTSGGHIRLLSPAKVSIALNAGYLRGNPVIVDEANLTGGIQLVKATLHATIHSTRKLKEGQKPAPIKQTVLEQITGVKPRTQHTYNKLIKQIKTRKNFHMIDSEWSDVEARHKAAIKYGFIFRFYDQEKRTRMIGRQLPNSYVSALELAPNGRRKKSNRQIRDALVQNEGPGNVKEKHIAIFHPDENQALTAFNRESNTDHYYQTGSILMPTSTRPARLRGAATWHAVGV